MRLQSLSYLFFRVDFFACFFILFLPPRSFLLFMITLRVFILNKVLLFPRFHEHRQSIESISFINQIVIDVSQHFVHFRFRSKQIVITFFPLWFSIFFPLPLLLSSFQMLIFPFRFLYLVMLIRTQIIIRYDRNALLLPEWWVFCINILDLLFSAFGCHFHILLEIIADLISIDYHGLLIAYVLFKIGVPSFISISEILLPTLLLINITLMSRTVIILSTTAN